MDNDINNPKGHRVLLHGDPVIWIIFFLLCAISIVEVYSATSSLSYKDGRYWNPVLNHSVFLIIGCVIVYMVHNIPCRWFKLYPAFLWLPCLIMLILVPFIGVSTNGANRILVFFGIHFQPSELAKGAVVVAVALILSKYQALKGIDKGAFKIIMWLTLPICIAIAPENLSTAGLLFLTVFVLMIVGRVSWKQLGKLLGVIFIIGALGIIVVMALPEKQICGLPMTKRVVTWKHRVEKFKTHSNTKEITPEDYDIANNAQVAHANIAIASSNVVGKMPGNSVQRDFLSQAYSDFIYAIIIEELGLVGGGFVVLLYVVLFFRVGKIAKQCTSNFPAFLILGLALLMVIQAMVNMCVAVGLIPVTGQPLPLVSRGGTSTLINCVYIGMILSVSRFAKKRDQNAVNDPIVNEAEFRNAEGIM